MQTIDFESLAAELLRAMRGARSQRALSRRLGYRTNVAYRWESQRCFPTGLQTLQALVRLGHAPLEKLRTFLLPTPAWLRDTTTLDAGLIVRLLTELRGGASLAELSRRTGASRFQLARWLSGGAQPRLHELLSLIEAMSLRLTDFVRLFFSADELPSVAALARRQDALREAAYAAPWSHAVLRVVELAEYRALPRHRPGYIAARLGITEGEERQALALLVRAGQLLWNGRRYRLVAEAAIDTRKDPARSRRLKAFWLEQARERLLGNQPGFYAYNLFSVSEADFERIRELHQRYYRDVQAVISQSQPNERIGLFCAQLVPIDPGYWPG